MRGSLKDIELGGWVGRKKTDLGTGSLGDEFRHIEDDFIHHSGQIAHHLLLEPLGEGLWGRWVGGWVGG